MVVSAEEVLLQAFVETIEQGFYLERHQHGILHGVLVLMFLFGLNLYSHSGRDEAMICPAFISTSDSSCFQYILLVTRSYDDIVNEVPIS